MNNDQQTSYHTRDVASGSTMTVERPPLALAYDEAAAASRAAWRRYEALDGEYTAAFRAIAEANSHEALAAALATLAYLRGQLEVASAIVTRLQREEYALYVQVRAWYAEQTQQTQQTQQA